jgi:hypothetical protein
MFIKIEVGRGTFSMRDVCHEIHRRHKRIHFQIDHLAETDDDDILSDQLELMHNFEGITLIF